MKSCLLSSHTAIPDWWQSWEDSLQKAVDEAGRGETGLLAMSPGGRPVRYVAYGGKGPGRMGAANFNSALAAGKPEAYCRRGPGSGMRPVLFVLAGVHGQEAEGMVAARSLLSIMETGMDSTGEPQQALAGKLKRLRLIVIPAANPDGRARVPYAGWAGLPAAEMTKWGQGTRKNGEPFGWPDCKAVHPIADASGILGGYFDDNGVNMMHDEWHSPMSKTTRAILELVALEGPDMLLNLHSHCYHPCILPVNYIPLSAKQTLLEFAQFCYDKMHAAGYRTGDLPEVEADGPRGQPPPSFNLSSMLYHAGCGASVLYESPHGCLGHVEPYAYGDILRLHHILFECAADCLLGAG